MALDKFKILGNFDEETNMTRVVCVDEFVGPYAGLVLGNGGSWTRFDGTFGKAYKAVTVKMDGAIRLSWEATEEEVADIQARIATYMRDSGKAFAKGTSIYLLFIYGLQTREGSRAIRPDIRARIIRLPCVVCGTNSQVECDHKNDLYNDPRVNNVATQQDDDFQPLCKHCNDQKRQVVKKMKETGKRYGATKIPGLAPLGIDFIAGGEAFNPAAVDAMVGTYWYDPVAFMTEVNRRLRGGGPVYGTGGGPVYGTGGGPVYGTGGGGGV